MAKYQKGISPANLDRADEAEDDESADFGEEQAGGARGAKAEDALEIINSIFPLGGRPFSAVHRQLVPRYFEEPSELFDEFGFRLPEESADAHKDPTLEKPPLESSSHRMRWLAMIESAHAQQVEDELCWAKVDVQRVRHAPKFLSLVHEGGIPHSLRPFLWPRFCSAVDKRKKSPYDYAKIVRKCGTESVPGVDVQIEKDLLHSLPTHSAFGRLRSLGIAPLRRVLRAVAFLFPELGYCHGMSLVVASMLLVCCEENVFWLMCSLIEDLLPASFYSPSLLGVRADERVLRHLIQVHMPEAMQMLEQCSKVDTTRIFVNWLITMLASAFSPRLLLRVWDHLFIFGSVTIFRVILAILKLGEGKLQQEQRTNGGGTFVPTTNTANLLSEILRIPSTIERPEHLLEMAQSFEYSVTDHLITELRKKYQGILMAEIGLIEKVRSAAGGNGGRADDGLEANLPMQTTLKRKLHRSKSVVRRIFENKTKRQGSADDNDDLRTKNVRQTELVLDLRNAILQICAHFAECQEARHCGRSVLTQADYSNGFDGQRECEQFLRARREGQKRGRALADFEQRDEDDLGFSKNDLIVIESEKDEHCWLGELDGRRGWFPAKFVQVLDERGKDYCARGDEVVCARIAELVRGPLAFAFHQILSHGLRSGRHAGLWPSNASSSSTHPWTFIEALSRCVIPTANGGVGAGGTFRKTAGGSGRVGGGNSKLTLCNTFCLDQDVRVLGPEELLHLAVRTIHRSHAAANAPADAKLRSLVAFGLNEQCLHLWFNIFCLHHGQDVLRQRHFRSWSFIRSPAAQQICCELKLLAQFAFSLDVNSELVSAEELARSAAAGMAKLCIEKEAGTKSGRTTPTEMSGANGTMLRDGVQDMLIKHHLFSWDL